MASESGFSNQKKLGTAQFKTIHNVGGDKLGQSVASKSVYEKTAVSVITVTEVLGISGQVEFLNVQYAAHLALPNDVLRIINGNFLNFEFDVISVVNSNNFRILPIVKASDITGANAIIMSWVTSKSNSDGTSIVSLASGPIQFVKNSTTVTVNEDTVTPANNVFLPVKDITSQASLSSIDGKFTTLNAKDFATSAKQDTGNSSLSSIDGKFTTLNAKDFATSAKQDTGNYSLSSIDGKIQVNGVVDAGNSSVIALGAGGVFTGAAVDVTTYAAINVCVASNVASDTNGIKVEFSQNNVNWDHSHQTTYPGTTGIGYIFNAEFKYARVVYTNSGTAQAYFRLQTILKSNPVQSSLFTLDQTPTGSAFAPLTKSAIMGKTTGGGGGFVDVKVNPSGALTVEATVSGVSTSALQTTLNNKTAAGLVTVAHDEIVTTYVGSTTDISTVVYKLATVTVATLTMSYDGSSRLINVVRS